MDQNINAEQKIKTEQKRVHKIGKFEYELTPGIGNDKDWVSFEEACQILTLKIDQVRKLSTAWEKKYDMADRVMKTFVPRQSVLDCLHQRNFHVAQDADHKPVQSEGEPSTFKPHEVHSPDPIPVGSGSHLGAPYGIYATADGFLALAMGSVPRLGELIGLPALAAYGDPATWFTQRDEIKQRLVDHLRTQPTRRCAHCCRGPPAWAIWRSFCRVFTRSQVRTSAMSQFAWSLDGKQDSKRPCQGRQRRNA